MGADLLSLSFRCTRPMTRCSRLDCSGLGKSRNLTQTIQTTKIRDGRSQNPGTRLSTTSNVEQSEEKGDSWPRRDSRESGLACLQTLRETRTTRPWTRKIP